MSVALITGGSAGLGPALVEALTDQGWTVITDARDGRPARCRRRARPDPGRR